MIVELLKMHVQWGLTCPGVFDLNIRLPYAVCEAPKALLRGRAASSEPSERLLGLHIWQPHGC